VSAGASRLAGRAGFEWAGVALAIVAAGWLAYSLGTRYNGSFIVIAVAGFALAGWMFITERLGLTLSILLLYLGLVDGFLRLRTGQANLTIARDLLLYAIAGGALARAVLRKESLALPPLSGWVLAFAAVVLVQLANPLSTGFLHTVAAVRPHLEFVPLFVLGYVCLRTTRSLRNLFVLILIVAAANGVVSLVQFNLTPEELSQWGPGYSERINGTGDVANRVFWDEQGQARVRPFGLGSDVGVGGLFGLIAIAPALALATFGWKSREARLAGLLSFGPVLAVITSQGRSVLIAAVMCAFVYLMLTLSPRRLVPTLGGVLVIAVVGSIVMSALAGSAPSGAFDRYKTITPDKIISSTENSRGNSISALPRLVREFPFGGGLGSVGPASTFAGGGTRGLDGETQFNFLVSELGVLGLVVFVLFNVKLFTLVVTRLRRIEDHEVHVLLAAVAATLAGLTTLWVSGAPTSGVPGGPYFWLAAGIFAWWLAPADGPWRRGAATRGRRLEVPANPASRAVLARDAAALVPVVNESGQGRSRP
jgi:hypothetical protein